MKGHILIIEDDRDMCEMLDVGLTRRGFTTKSHIHGKDGVADINNEQPDVVLTDINLPDFNGVQVCQEVTAKWPEIPVIMMTAFGSMETAIGAIRAGAYDFITKPLDMDILSLTLERAVNHRTLQQQVKVLSRSCHEPHSFSELLGESQAMRDLFSRLMRIADTDASVLITGESGSGKELTARALHACSRRKDNPFIAVNCSALPENLLESELFGHVKGAFTDARVDRKGLFLEADGGTLFLDEIGDLPLQLQPKLLRVLEERKIRPVGGNTEKNFDVRLLAATNSDIETDVAEGRFREDLFYRLNVIKVHIPPLRARGTDILLLAEQFIEDYAERHGKKVSGLTEATAKIILTYDWPGNVRELRNAMEHAVAMTLFDKIVPEDLPDKIKHHSNNTILFEAHDPNDLISMEEMSQRYISYVLDITKGNQTLAAQVLQIDRKTLYRRLQKSGNVK
jgi:DNA-binding NtrC family response regulator